MLYLDLDAYKILKAKGENVSGFVNRIILTEANMKAEDKDDKEMRLRLANTELQRIIENKDKEIKELNKKIEELKEDMPKVIESYKI